VSARERPTSPGLYDGGRDAIIPAMQLRSALVLGSILASVSPLGCTVKGEEVATTFFDPMTSASGPPATSGNEETEGDTDPPATSSDTEATADSGNTSSATTDDPMTTSPDSSGGGEDEQPSSGMYSECASGAECIGLTTCVVVPGAEGGGFCSNAGCGNPLASCVPNPGATSTATPACIDDGSGMMVCALSCTGGATCPTGMQCLPVGGTMACA